MGDERLGEKTKQPVGPETAPPKRRDDVRAEDLAAEAADTSHAGRQLAMRGAAPSPGTFSADPERAYETTGENQATLWPEVERILDRKADATTLAAKVAGLDREGRDKVAVRIADVAKVAPGGVVLQIGDLVGLSAASKIRSALDASLDVSALRAHVLSLTTVELGELLDGPTRARFAELKLSPAVVAPHVAAMSWPVPISQPLVQWYLAATPTEVVAHTMMRVGSDAARALSETLNALGKDAWSWAFAVTEAMVGSSPTAGLNLEFTPAFEEVTAALAARTPKHGSESQKGAAPGGAGALKALVPAGSIDVAALTRAIADVVTFEKHEVRALGLSPYRERLIAAATPAQLAVLLDYMGVSDADQLDWFLDSTTMTLDNILTLSSSWAASSISYEFKNPKLVAKLFARFPKAGPGDVFGVNRAAVCELAQSSPAVRAWCAVTAQPQELLQIITFAVPTIAKMWNLLVADGLDPRWVERLGAGSSQDTRLRSLVLNCPDPTAAAWVRDHLIGDKLEAAHAGNKPLEIGPMAYEGNATKRLEDGLTHPEVSTAEIGRRTSELSAAELVKLRENPEQLAAVLSLLHDHWLPRVLALVEPPLIAVLRTADLRAGIAAYVRTRPSSETTAAFRDDAVASRVRRDVRDPFTLLPALREPGVLAIVGKSSDTLQWLLERTDAPFAISLLGHPEVAKSIAPSLSDLHLDRIPEVMVLSTDQRAALERIANAVKDSTIRQSLRDRLEAEVEERDPLEPRSPVTKPEGGVANPTDTQRKQDELEAALEHADFAGALDVVLTKPPTRANVLAVCRERASMAPQLLSKPEHGARVDRLRQVLDQSPVAVFPTVPWFAFLHTAEARRWLFEHEPPTVILAELAHEPQLAHLVLAKLAENDPPVRTWIDALPKGTALTPVERRQVRQLFDLVTTDLAARRLFEIRFGSKVISKTYTHDELARLWTLFERVPDAHIEQGSITHLSETPAPALPGQFGGGAMHFVEGLTRDGKDNHQYSGNLQLTRAQLTTAYGYDDAQLEARISAEEITKIETPDGTRYEIQKKVVKLLDFTVLHEIGHAVDEMLGEQNELVYGLAGWRHYNESDVGQLAKDLGGWERVAPADQQRIQDVWVSWMNMRTWASLDTLVGDDHPALSKKYKGVGIVELGRSKAPPFAGEAPPINGHHVVASHKNQQFYRIPDRTRNAAPSPYSLTAPGEYFAECYAEYYYSFTGPGTEDKKGGRLPGWIKGWFDQNIDTLKHNPSRDRT